MIRSRNTRSKGKLYEDLAVEFLQKKGYRIIARNFGCFWGEIDIIAIEGGQLVFLEIKGRSSDRFGYPFEAVDERKIKRILRTGWEFCEKTNQSLPREVRVDVVSLLWKSGENKIKVELIKDVTAGLADLEWE